MYRFLDATGYAVDVNALRARFPDIRWHSFAVWAREQSWSAGERR